MKRYVVDEDFFREIIRHFCQWIDKDGWSGKDETYEEELKKVITKYINVSLKRKTYGKIKKFKEVD